MEPGLEIGPVNCGKLLNCNEFMKYVVQIVNKERRSLQKIIIIIIIINIINIIIIIIINIINIIIIINIININIIIIINRAVSAIP